MRLTKAVLKNTFPNFTDVALNSTQAQIDAVVTAAPAILAYLVQPGMISDWGGATAPSGWLGCDGQSLATTGTYAALFAAIGYTWGGSGASFNAPNLMSHFRRHRDTAGLNYAGAVGTLQAPANLAHTHGVNINSGAESADHTHTSGSLYTGNMSANASHSHQEYFPNGGGGAAWYTGTAGTSASMLVGVYTAPTNTDHTHAIAGSTGGMSVAHYHNVSGTTAGGSADNANEARPYSATVLTCIKF
jgi:microcystin-dependent protein